MSSPSNQPPPPYPPQATPPGAYQATPPAHGWIDASGRWQPGQPPQPPQPPKKSSTGVLIALAILAGLLVLGVIGVVASSAGSEPSFEEQALADLDERLDGAGNDFQAVNQLTEELIADDLVDLNGLESRCVATQLVDGLGADRSLAITAAEIEAGLPLAEAEEFADAYVDCVDLAAFFARGLESDPATAGLPEFYVTCLFDELGVDFFRTEFVGAISGTGASDAELEQAGADAGDRCIASFTPEQLDELANS